MVVHQVAAQCTVKRAVVQIKVALIIKLALLREITVRIRIRMFHRRFLISLTKAIRMFKIRSRI